MPKFDLFLDSSCFLWSPLTFKLRSLSFSVLQFDNDVQELRMIFEGQDHIHQAINGINRRINEMLGIAQTLSSQVSQLQQNQGAAVQHVSDSENLGSDLFCFVHTRSSGRPI